MASTTHTTLLWGSSVYDNCLMKQIWATDQLLIHMISWWLVSSINYLIISYSSKIIDVLLWYLNTNFNDIDMFRWEKQNILTLFGFRYVLTLTLVITNSITCSLSWGDTTWVYHRLNPVCWPGSVDMWLWYSIFFFDHCGLWIVEIQIKIIIWYYSEKNMNQ